MNDRKNKSARRCEETTCHHRRRCKANSEDHVFVLLELGHEVSAGGCVDESARRHALSPHTLFLGHAQLLLLLHLKFDVVGVKRGEEVTAGKWVFTGNEGCGGM